MPGRRAALAVVVAMLLGSTASPAHAGRPYYDDPVGDPVDCNTNDALPDRGIGDIRGVALAWPGAGAPADDDLDRGGVEVRMAENAEAAYETAFSYAVMLLGYLGPAGDTIRQYLLEIHSGERKIGEFDPDSGEPVESDADVTVTGDMVNFDLGVDLSVFSKLEVRAFSMPTEGDPTSCDRLEISEDELAAAAGGAVADDDGTAIDSDSDAGDDAAEPVPADETAAADDSDSSSTFLILGLIVGVLAFLAFLAWMFGPWNWTRKGGNDDDDSIVDELSGDYTTLA